MKKGETACSLSDGSVYEREDLVGSNLRRASTEFGKKTPFLHVREGEKQDNYEDDVKKNRGTSWNKPVFRRQARTVLIYVSSNNSKDTNITSSGCRLYLALCKRISSFLQHESIL